VADGDDVGSERARQLGVLVAIVLTAAGLTYFFVQMDADDRVLAAQAHDASRLAECEEASATRHIELEGRLAECELDRVHGRCATLGDHVGEATVTAVSGRTDVRVGDTCRVELDWNSDPIEGCRGFVRCSRTALYGDLGSGFFECEVDEDGIVHGEDDEPTSEGEGDPRFVVDRESSELTVSEDAPAWSVTMTVPALREAALEE
jgi:hypothetical protein